MQEIVAKEIADCGKEKPRINADQLLESGGLNSLLT
jgi:hypothetical protein